MEDEPAAETPRRRLTYSSRPVSRAAGSIPPPPLRAEPGALSTPVASRAPYQLADGRWELGSHGQQTMIKSSDRMVKRLEPTAAYDDFRHWVGSVTVWVEGHASVPPKQLGPAAIRTVAHLSLAAKLHQDLEDIGALGAIERAAYGRVTRGDTTWDTVLSHVRDILKCS